MDATTLVVILLLVGVASLASYLLTQWNAVRGGVVSIGWVALSVGTLLLLVAAAVAVLTAGFPKVWLSFSKPGEPSRESAAGIETRARVPERQLAEDELRPAIQRPASVARSVRDVPDQEVLTDAPTVNRAPDAASPANPQRSIQPAAGGAPRAPGPVFAASDPWAATKCVVAINPDPAQLTRWTLESECGVPVAILFASCSAGPHECAGSQSWNYQEGPLTLPDKARRPVPLVEQTRNGKSIRFAACFLSSPAAIELIGQDRETRTSSSWREEFEAARSGDECLTRVHDVTRAGRESGQPIDALLRAPLPGGILSGFGD